MKSSIFLVVAFSTVGAYCASPDATEIVRRSVEVLDRDWKQAPAYSFIENDVEIKNGNRSAKRSAVIMLDGSPYWMLLEENDKPLPPHRIHEERRKLAQQALVRRRQSQVERQQRIAQYDKDRRRDNALIREMADAFDFKLVGEQDFRGYPVYVLAAHPKPGYQPKSQETRVLTNMRGKLWIDRKTYQWVRVQAEVMRPVAFGWFVAKVQPGTRFTLDQAPVGDSVWLPSRFTMSLNAAVLWWRKLTSEDDTFSGYRRADESRALLAGSDLHAAQ